VLDADRNPGKFSRETDGFDRERSGGDRACQRLAVFSTQARTAGISIASPPMLQLITTGGAASWRTSAETSAA